MSKSVIQALSPLTIQKIAAGEVIERPANVIKEMVENALDAGATKISITLEDGGKELIRIADNGIGMNQKDLLQCWLPHTTSKIREVDDLESVSSFGFRGEALASIAAVSELTLESRYWEDEMGSRLKIIESSPEPIEIHIRNAGTTITVRNLFRNNPVRRKFLASGKSECGKISALLTKLFLAHPGVSLKLTEGNREVLNLQEGTLRRRVGDVFGTHVLGDLLKVDWEGGGIHVSGFVSEPQRFSSRQGQQHFFVNRRHIHSGLLTRAFLQAYETIPPGRYPVGALFLTLSPAEIDVNIHPTKREIRFLQEARIFWAISQSLRQAFRQNINAPALELTAPVPTPLSPLTLAAEENTPAPFTYSMDQDADIFSAEKPIQSVPIALDLEPQRNPTPTSLEMGAPCLQIHHSFILVAVQSGFLLVNQQAAHERILFEHAMDDIRAARGGRFNAQQLLFPELLEFTDLEARAIEEHLDHLRALGFDLEPFGTSAYQLRGLPAEISSDKAQFLLKSLLAHLLDTPRTHDKSMKDVLAERVAGAYARTAAIPLGEILEGPKMAGLIDGLFATRNPYVTPSGAPVLIRYSLEEIRRRFGIKMKEET